jgi:hypothetical protein
LMEAGQVEGEQVQVLRNVAGALGAIGPEAPCPLSKSCESISEYAGLLKQPYARLQESPSLYTVGHDACQIASRMAGLSISTRKPSLLGVDF